MAGTRRPGASGREFWAEANQSWPRQRLSSRLKTTSEKIPESLAGRYVTGEGEKRGGGVGRLDRF